VLYGLSSAIVTSDKYRGMELAAKVKAGAVHVSLPIRVMTDP